MLSDGSGAVTRAAVVALRHHIGNLDPALFEALLTPDNASHVRFAGYRLLTGGDTWQRLATNLALVDDPDLRLRAGSRADIANWLERQAATTYRAPDPARAGSLARLIEQARPVLGGPKTRLLRFHAGLGTGPGR